MLWTKMPLRPPASRVKLNPQEITDLAKHAVLHHAHQFAAGITDPERGSQRNRALYLQACTRNRNVLQVRHSSAGPAGLIFPLDVHEVRAEHPGFNTPI